MRPRAIAAPTVVVVMGVSGSGKTTIGQALAHLMGWPWQEGDELHPAENVEKMSRGEPLTDADRLPWLQRVASVIESWRLAGQSAVVTCSALKLAYRRIILTDPEQVVLAYARGSHALIAERMAHRHGHFMPTSLLDSQFAVLQEPTADERPIVISISDPVARIVQHLVDALAERRPGAD